MKLQIERRYVESLIETFPNLIALKEQLRFGNKAEVFYQQLAAHEWGFLHDLYRNAGATMQNQAALLSTLQTALNDGGDRYEAEQLEMLLPAVTRYLIDDAQRGWLFHADAKGRTCAYLITRLDFTPPGEEEAGRILIELKAN
ncbi:MAG: AAA family ATPase, partial [Methylobacter sp.]|nr:AAA family ATPase [Methylobacter sp.]